VINNKPLRTAALEAINAKNTSNRFWARGDPRGPWYDKIRLLDAHHPTVAGNEAQAKKAPNFMPAAAADFTSILRPLQSAIPEAHLSVILNR
jgi:hypothetical protein